MADKPKTPPAAQLATAFIGGRRPLVFYRQEFYSREAYSYRRIERLQIEQEFYEFTLANIGVPSAQYVKSGVDAMAITQWIDGKQSAPFWLNGKTGEYHLVLANGMLPLTTIISGTPQLVPHDPDYFVTAALDYDFDPSATCARWQEFVWWLAGGNIEVIATLREFTASAILPIKHQKSLWLVGAGSNGKSTFTGVIRQVLGPANVSHVAFESFNNLFRVASAADSLLNIASDVGDTDRVAEGMFKMLSAGDPLDLDRKYRDPISVEPRAKFIFCCNTLPRFRDRTNGVWRRLIVVPCAATVADEDADGDLGDKLTVEKAGILNWLLEGAARLATRGKLTIPAICSREVDAARLDANPAATFLMEHVEEGPVANVEIAQTESYLRYHEWAKLHGFDPLNAANFYREVRVMFPGVKVRRRGPRGVHRPRVFAGITWRRDCPFDDGDDEAVVEFLQS